jgi:hypothetical protein
MPLRDEVLQLLESRKRTDAVAAQYYQLLRENPLSSNGIILHLLSSLFRITDWQQKSLLDYMNKSVTPIVIETPVMTLPGDKHGA